MGKTEGGREREGEEEGGRESGEESGRGGGGRGPVSSIREALRRSALARTWTVGKKGLVAELAGVSLPLSSHLGILAGTKIT